MNSPSSPFQTTHPTPLGTMLIAASEQGLVGCWFLDDKHIPDHAHWPALPIGSTTPQARWIEQTQQQLDAYFSGQVVDNWHASIPTDLSGGTPFQQAVWQALLGIAQGASQSYGQIAQHIGKPAAVRAVGAAIGRNPISILIPCHRVLGKDGSLTGYAGGLHRKQALLKLEGVLA
jgi:methylated-DNA-[protein]-cysteine S-methyltransferase